MIDVNVVPVYYAIPSLLPTFLVISIAGVTLPITAYSAFKDHDTWTKKLLLPISGCFLVGLFCLFGVLLSNYLFNVPVENLYWLFNLYLVFILAGLIALSLFIISAFVDINDGRIRTNQIKKQIFNENHTSIIAFIKYGNNTKTKK